MAQINNTINKGQDGMDKIGSIFNGEGSISSGQFWGDVADKIGSFWNRINGTTQAQKEQERYQAQQNAYNSAGAQKARLMGAGYSERQAMDILAGSSSPAGTQTQAVQAQNGGGLAGMLGSILSMGQMGTGIAQGVADTHLSEQQALGQAVENKYQDVIKSTLIQQANEQLYALWSANNWNDYVYDWQQTCDFYLENGMRREDILSELEYRYMMVQLFNDPNFNQYFPDYTERDLNFDIARGMSPMKDGVPNEPTRLTISQEEYDKLSWDDKKHYRLQEDEHGRKQWTEVSNSSFQPTKWGSQVSENDFNQWFMDSYTALFSSDYNQDWAKAQSANAQSEIRNWLQKLSNEDRQLIADGNLQAIRQKMLETKDNGDPKWWQVVYYALENIAGPMSALGVRVPNISIRRNRSYGQVNLHRNRLYNQQTTYGSDGAMRSSTIYE